MGLLLSDDFPELIDLDRVYVVSAASRSYLEFLSEHGKRTRCYIIFYGGVNSGIRMHTYKFRYICGSIKHIVKMLHLIEFSTWMDYRLYTASMNDDFTYCKVGTRIDFSAEKLLSMATRLRYRKRISLTKRMKAMNKVNVGSKESIRISKMMKRTIDSKVKSLMDVMKDIGFVSRG